jgi:hypothetical protein
MANGRPMENEDTRSEVVYGHKLRDEADYFHIGSGSVQRAHNLNGRSSL